MKITKKCTTDTIHYLHYLKYVKMYFYVGCPLLMEYNIDTKQKVKYKDKSEEIIITAYECYLV